MSDDTKKLATIVVATDFSADARAALEWATDVARERGARVVLTHAVTMIAPAAPEFLPIEPGFYATLRESAQAELNRLADFVRSKEVPVETALGYEPAVEGVLEVVEKHHADLLVVGTRGLTGLKRLVLGSVAARLVRKAPCPVVTIHSADPGGHRPVRTILIPTDMSDDASRAADAAAQILGDSQNHRVVLLHVYRYPVVFSTAPTFVLTGAIADFVRDARAQMEKLADRFRQRGITVEILVEEGLPSQRILEHAVELQVDVIAMGTHGRSGIDRLFLGSTAERVLPAAPCPVLTVHTPEQPSTEPQS